MTTVTIDDVKFELEWQGKVLEKPSDWPPGALSYPSIMLDEGLYKMWFAGFPYDWIYYSESAEPFGPFTWNWKEQAVTPGPPHAEVPANDNPDDPTVCVYPVRRAADYGYRPCPPTKQPDPATDPFKGLTRSDSWMTADPCVLRVEIDGGDMRYYMWYTGTEFNGVRNAIFFAESIDGKTWEKKYRKVLTESGCVGLCVPFMQPQSPMNQDKRRGYGMGQSSVIQLPDRFYHYFTDTTVPHGESVIRLIRMTGPFTLEGWPPKPVPMLGGSEDTLFTSWDVKYCQAMHRMIAFNADFGAPDLGRHKAGLRISVSEPLNSGPDAASLFSRPVAIPIEELGVPGSNMNNGGLLGDRRGWIVDTETAFYFGFGTSDHNTWNIGALRVRVSKA